MDTMGGGMRIQLTRRATLIGAASALCSSGAWAQDDESASPLAGTTLRFASVDAGQRVLAADDDWLGVTGGFQRRAMMGSSAAVTLEQFRRWNADAVRPWSAAERTRWRAAARAIESRVRELRLPLPSETLLVRSNGQESAGMPYTRANAIVVTFGNAAPPQVDAWLMAHELWHVVSRHAPALADRAYREIGFEPMPELEWPAAWGEIRIANPDAPANRHALRTELGGRAVLLTPALVASRTQLQPGEPFAALFEVRLLEVRPDADGKRSRAVVDANGQPHWHAIDRVPAFLERSGGNTPYVIHPEETMADNVAFLLTGRPARNGDLLRRIEAALKGA
jgi:hypothetical protein